ncbi:uncharacterized protein LOC132261023 [Phlebotomus argentipes]|uniref:uncharacterized protein LOC132261023 n=1 Tax=Phlebotomus argentipes TaxID=94469 RepID=UPI00289372FD|nr:uncharacterized protein LOC132261023 [Phlebotomus argentipes]
MPHALWLVISLSVIGIVTCNPTTLRPLYGQRYEEEALPPIYNSLSDVQKYPPSEYTEPIFLPIPAKNYHPQKTHETLSREPKDFNPLDFSAYTVRPSRNSKAEESEEVTESSRESTVTNAPPKDFPMPSYVTFYGKILPRIEKLPDNRPQPLIAPRPKPRRSMNQFLGNPTAIPLRLKNDELRANKQTKFRDVEFIHPTVGRARDVDKARLIQFEDTTEKNQDLEVERELTKKILYDDVFYHPESKRKHKRKTPKLASYKNPKNKPNDGDFSFIVFTGDKNGGKSLDKSAKLRSPLKNFPGKKRERGIITNTTKVYYNFEHTHKPNKQQAQASDHYETTLPNPELSDATERYSSKYRTPDWEILSDEKEYSGQQRPPFLPTVLTPLVRIEKPQTDDYLDDQKEANSDKSEKQKNRDSDDVQQYFQFVNVLGHDGSYNAGARKGNDNHFVESFERKGKGKFQRKVRWGDKEGGYGEHVWDLNHHKEAKSA